MKGYTIVDREQIDTHILFIRIEPVDIVLTLKDVFESLSNLAWISAFDKEYVQNGFKVRAESTIDYISKKIIKADADTITHSSGEYVISELARKTIVEELDYLDVPLAELIKEKAVGNHGFDFYSKNTNLVLLFGEAKYNATQNAYGSSFEQIARFVREGQDESDLLDIDKFCCEHSKENFTKGKKGFVAAFATRKTSTKTLISNIKKNADFKSLTGFDEVICVAVNLCKI
jgi:hypothetical protein